MPLFKKDKDKVNGHGNNNNGNGFHSNGRESMSSMDSTHSYNQSKTPSPTKMGQSTTPSSEGSRYSPAPPTPGQTHPAPAPPSSQSQVNQSKLVFHCQQAQGSPTGLISGFANVKELYEKIADCYGFLADDILFCTLNTHRIDMDNLLSAQLCLDDFIFVHRKGTKKSVEVVKSEEALGLTITDNGTGYAFIKRIKDDSIIDSIKTIHVGDHIEGIDDQNLVGWRHVDVAKYLKAIPIGTTFTVRLVEPLRAGFANIGPKSDSKRGNVKSGKGVGNGRETLRLRNNGPAQIEKAPEDFVQVAIDRINRLLENFMGINDADLAAQIWEMAEGKGNTMDFAEAVDNSELESFGFTDDFIIEVWGIVTDAKSGRLVRSPQFGGDDRDSPNGTHLTDLNIDELNDQDLANLMMNSTPASRKSRVK